MNDKKPLMDYRRVQKLQTPLLLTGALLSGVGTSVSVPLVILGIAIMLFAIVIGVLYYRCPHCGRPLGRIGEGGAYCPHCGKALDAPVDEPVRTVSVPAYAKLNLTLDILGKRDDGYHEMQMVMQTVSLHDDVTVTLDDTGTCRAETNRSYLPCGADNVAVRAAQVFLERAGLDCGVHIPDEASAKAKLAQLEELGALVGSDVPYCVAGGTMLAEGRGERLTPVTPMPRLPVVICKPDFPISTPELFRRVDARTSRCRPDTEGICAALADGDMPKLARRMYNVFEDVLTRREGEIAAIKSRLLDGGALGAVMSGTGSAVFGLFADADSAAYAKRRLARDYAECFLTETIDRLDV